MSEATRFALILFLIMLPIGILTLALQYKLCGGWKNFKVKIFGIEINTVLYFIVGLLLVIAVFGATDNLFSSMLANNKTFSEALTHLFNLPHKEQPFDFNYKIFVFFSSASVVMANLIDFILKVSSYAILSLSPLILASGALDKLSDFREQFIKVCLLLFLFININNILQAVTVKFLIPIVLTLNNVSLTSILGSLLIFFAVLFISFIFTAVVFGNYFFKRKQPTSPKSLMRRETS
jgi:hypothetical protein